MNEVAAKYRSLGLSVMPIGDKKRPMVKWTEAQKAITVYNFSEAHGIGVICGKVSGNLEAIDFDLKYDISGDLMKRYRKAVEEINPTLIKRLLIQKTPSGGFHFVYRCPVIAGNQKLAQRHATDEEKAAGDKVLVLIETRGEGGYIGFAPFSGYSIVSGNVEQIPTITEGERETLLNCAMQFNEVFAESYIHRPKMEAVGGESPIDDYNLRGDALGLLQKHGWTVVGQKGQKTMFKRPGNTDALTSGNWDEGRRWFTVFTTSTEFKPQTAYRAAAIYCMLECGNDWSETARRLLDEGFGEKRKLVEQKVESKIVHPVSIIKPADLSFLAKREDYESDLERIARNEYEMGLTTGILSLDKHFLWKKKHLNINNGFDNVGKTSILWYLMLLNTLYHGWKWMVMVSENSPTTFFRRMTEFYYGEGYVGMNELKRKRAMEFLEAHFFVVKNEQMYTYLDVMQMASNLSPTGLLVDPWNSLAMIGGIKSNKHEHDHMALTELQLMCKKQDMTAFVNTHSVTSTYRSREGNAPPKAPGKGDTEGGTKFASKASDFITFHRNVQDETDWRKMEIHVRKVKEMETGGKPTFATEPVILEMEYGVRYVEKDGRDPIAEYWKKKGNGQQSFVIPAPDTAPVKPNANFLSRYEPKAYDDDDDPITQNQECPF